MKFQMSAAVFDNIFTFSACHKFMTALSGQASPETSSLVTVRSQHMLFVVCFTAQGGFVISLAVSVMLTLPLPTLGPRVRRVRPFKCAVRASECCGVLSSIWMNLRTAFSRSSE